MLCRFHVEAEQDPQVSSRLLALLTVRNTLPERFSSAKDGTRLQIVFETLCRDEPASRLLTDRIQSIPTVNRVTCILFPGRGIAIDDDAPAPAFWI